MKNPKLNNCYKKWSHFVKTGWTKIQLHIPMVTSKLNFITTGMMTILKMGFTLIFFFSMAVMLIPLFAMVYGVFTK